MEPYYFAGYYLMKPKPGRFDVDKGEVVRSCSTCINTSVYDVWCLSWIGAASQLRKEDQVEFGLTDEKVQEIHHWADEKFEQQVIHWGNAFSDLETVTEFKRLFFEHLLDAEIYAIYLDEADADSFLEEFQDESDSAMYHNLKKKIGEQSGEELMGYDFIGIEYGNQFHSFRCYDIAETMQQKFGLERNQHGLFDPLVSKEATIEYLEDQDTGLAFVPWYVAKTKRIQL